MDYTRRKKAGIALAAVLIAFGLSQYAAATGISVSVTGSELVGEGADGARYDLSVAVSNPTLLPLAVGQTEFTVSDGKTAVGSGTIEPFVMPIMGSAVVGGGYLVYPDAAQDGAAVRISGVTAYNLLFVSVAIPFEYDTADGFIHRT